MYAGMNASGEFGRVCVDVSVFQRPIFDLTKPTEKNYAKNVF